MDDAGWERCTAAARKVFNKKLLFKRIPILSWLPSYNREQAVSDLIAGLTVGLTIIPQGIAYAIVAQLPPQVTFFFLSVSTCLQLIPSFIVWIVLGFHGVLHVHVIWG